ncbi:3-deoxy-manno-octulosonate cytidylyltransferase [Psychromonas ossibalaenae]|uniref:3-deoxy-manno-octulosonate cytidylyltransferase n=1 Tax=Psychromonas ossibalaenae TaxID=444922 RepID=UPI00036613E6|nr:3-deoxy-manno-octulosonate cytidylyltransferase [Psychromonas ossibalaenae]
MMILDCTLRDGGYINNWQFKGRDIRGIITSLVVANIDLIEIGYLSHEQHIGNTYSKDINNLTSYIGNDFSDINTKFVVMCNYGELDIKQLPAKCVIPSLSGIRLAFHRKDWHDAIRQAKEIKALGYQVFIQPMVTANYSDMELLALLEEVNKLAPYAFYLVDSFGNMDASCLNRLALLVDHNLSSDILMGFHSHNNMQLSLSNAMTFFNMSLKRELIVDSSLMGMGRGAGNLPTEVLINSLKHIAPQYQLLEVLEAIDNYIEPIAQQYNWGPNLGQFLSAAAGTHPNYASYLINQKTLPVSIIQRLLNELNEVEKNNYRQEAIETIYLDYNKRENTDCCDTLPFDVGNLLLIAPGTSVALHQSEIEKKVIHYDYNIIAINHVPDTLKADYLFFSNQKRYNEFAHFIWDSTRLIVTSNLSMLSQHRACIRLNFKTLYENSEVFSNNAVLLLLNALSLSGSKRVSIAGLDGYQINSDDLIHGSSYGALSSKEKASRNEEVLAGLKKITTNLSIQFLTPSLYKKDLPLKIAVIIPARYKSSRFPGKPLAKIAGIPMIKRTYQQVVNIPEVDTFILTDNQQIKAFCLSQNMSVIMTSEQCLTGTDRVAEFASRYDYDLYVNVQGDEPVIDPSVVNEVIDSYRIHGEQYIAYNCFKEVTESEFNTPTIVKVVLNNDNELIYMSRAALPVNYSKQQKLKAYRQVCVYGFTKHALEVFTSNDKTRNEKYEDIELLRLVDLGHKVKMTETTFSSIAVDVPEDIDKVEAFLTSKGIE